MGSRGLKQWVVTSISHMGEMHDSDWSRQNLLRSDWLGPSVATMTTDDFSASDTGGSQGKIRVLPKGVEPVECSTTKLQETGRR